MTSRGGGEGVSQKVTKSDEGEGGGVSPKVTKSDGGRFFSSSMTSFHNGQNFRVK